MAKIYNDIPDDFTKIANRIDATKVDYAALPAQLAEIENKFIKPNVKKRTTGGQMIENPKIPQLVADILNRYDWKSVGILKRKVAKVEMEKKLKALGLLIS